MKTFITLLISLNAQASFIKELCQNPGQRLIYSDALVTDGNSIWNLEGKHLSTHEKVLSLAGNWMLQEDRIVELGSLTTYDLPDLSVLSWGRKLVLKGESLFVIHEQGVSLFDLGTTTFKWSRTLSDVSGGEAVSGDHDGSNLIIVIAGAVQEGFNGIVVMDLEGNQLSTLPYNRSRSGIIVPSAKASWHRNKLYINNSGWIHTVDKKQLSGKRAIVARNLSTYVALPDGTRRKINPTGEFYFNKKALMSCGSFGVYEDGQVRVKGDLFQFPL